MVLIQPLQHRSDNERQPNCGIYEHFAEPAAFSGWNELSPGNRFAIRAAGQASPKYWLRANAQAVVIAFERQVLTQLPVAQFNERSELLRPVARHASADGKYAEFLLLQQCRGEVFKIKKGIEPQRRTLIANAGAISQGETLDEARENLKEAIQLILEVNRENAFEDVDTARIIRERIVVGE